MFTKSGTLTPQRKRRPWAFPATLMLLALLISGSGVYLALRESQTEPVLIWARTVVAGQTISADDIVALQLPRNRPAALVTLPASYPVTGMWALSNASAGELITSSQLSAQPPKTPFYPNGAALPSGMVALPFSTQTVGPVSDQDTINVSFIDHSGDPQRCTALGGSAQSGAGIQMDDQGRPLPITCRLLPQMAILYVDQTTSVAYLAATPYQSQAVYTLAALPDVQLYGERYGSMSEPLPFLTVLSPSTLEAELLSGPISVTNPLLPGIRQPLPVEGQR